MSAYDDERELTYSDVIQAAKRRDPLFADLVRQYLEQSDPAENAPEEPPDNIGEDDEEREEPPPLPRDAWTLSRLRSAMQPYNMWGKNADEKYALRREAWEALLAAPYPPPRLHLGAMMIEMYERGDEWSRAQLIQMFRTVRVGWGVWKGFKTIYKLAEKRHDPEIFGILAWRFDAMSQTSTKWGEITAQTFSYMRRRAWRYLRQLGAALPELYPHFAVQVLRHYPAHFRFYSSWIANQIWAHERLIGARTAWQSGPPKKLSERAFDDAWKISAAPLLRLLEDAQADGVCDFAIRSLKADFPESLREVDASWLARIGVKKLASVHVFVVEILEGSPEFHQSKLKGLGLHDMVVRLLRSDSEKAGKYAIEYVKSYAPDIPVTDLIGIAEDSGRIVKEFVRARLAKKKPRELGLQALIRMLSVNALEKLAKEKFEEGFKPSDLTAELYVALANGSSAQQNFVKSFFKKNKVTVPASFLRARVEDEDMSYWERRRVMTELGKRKARDIGIQWIKDGLLDARFNDYISDWLQRGMLKGKDLDVEWVKDLTKRPKLRYLAISLLGNIKFVAPTSIGLDWLLAMARHADDSLSTFAHRYLLEHFAPDDFALEIGATEVEAGIDKIWSLLDKEQADPVRAFASIYLRVHHPEISSTMSESREFGIKPKLPRKSYTLARVRPLFSDLSTDMRRLGRALGKRELIRWGERELVYELAASSYREARALAADALLHIGEPEADPKLVPPPAWLIPARVFALAESPIKATREIALTLIRRHYATLGGAQKLGWLMESPDREVRLFAVRLLWEKHRPVDHPAALASTHQAKDAQNEGGDAVVESHERFESVEALQQFLRTVLFGLPPGRMERRDNSSDALPDRPLPSSVAKRRLIGVVRDMGVTDRGFASVVSPVLEEFMNSQAKGEWHSCVAALAQMRRVHPDLQTSLPQASA